MKMINQAQEDDGLIAVLYARYKSQRLPRVEALQQKVAGGSLLNRFDIMFLDDVASSVNEVRPLLDRHPECLSLATHLTNLCHGVVTQALANEKTMQSSRLNL